MGGLTAVGFKLLRHDVLRVRRLSTSLQKAKQAQHLAVAVAAGGAVGGVLFHSVVDEVVHLPSGNLSTEAPSICGFAAGGAVAAVVASTTPQRMGLFNSIVQTSAITRAPWTTVARTAGFGLGVGLRTASNLWICLGANATGAVCGAMTSLNPSESTFTLAFPLVSFSVFTLLVVPAFWAGICFGAVGLATGAAAGVWLAQGGCGVVALSTRQAALRRAFVRCCVASPVALAGSVAMGLAPNVLSLVMAKMDAIQFGDVYHPEASQEYRTPSVDWTTRRSRFREM
ncbi:unnamed protein product [Durusdinium trenchii]|uniref:Uncharacterized protein n=1 Tax=Durusdinium trenchii TaxID=1381693 RepID=A0ABP0HVS0_9DINO